MPRQPAHGWDMCIVYDVAQGAALKQSWNETNARRMGTSELGDSLMRSCRWWYECVSTGRYSLSEVTECHKRQGLS